MGSPNAPSWTLAARAAYFGDRTCAFCDRRNPAGAKYCNDCASPLHLKPCNQCDGVNEQAATECYKCGAASPVFDAPQATFVLPSDNPEAGSATPGDLEPTAITTEPPVAASALRADWRLVRPRQLVLAAVATSLIAGAYAAYHINATTPEAMAIASQPISAPQYDAPTSQPISAPRYDAIALQPISVPQYNALAATPAVPMAVESIAVEPERSAAAEAPYPATPKRASGHLRPVPAPATKHASAPQRPPERQARVGATPSVARHVAVAHVSARVAETRTALRPVPSQVMHVSLAHCDGNVFARIMCYQRVRGHFCEGHWGETPECGSGVANEHRP